MPNAMAARTPIIPPAILAPNVKHYTVEKRVQIMLIWFFFHPNAMRQMIL